METMVQPKPKSNIKPIQGQSQKAILSQFKDFHWYKAFIH
ncbi:hypothetical protein AO373_1275 [Moraxella catarrhalis]|nr:hypothetical protein AO373_1275 [Moraxella catarrhalis]